MALGICSLCSALPQLKAREVASSSMQQLALMVKCFIHPTAAHCPTTWASISLAVAYVCKAGLPQAKFAACAKSEGQGSGNS
jgi:hypothetical protein